MKIIRKKFIFGVVKNIRTGIGTFINIALVDV